MGGAGCAGAPGSLLSFTLNREGLRGASTWFGGSEPAVPELLALVRHAWREVAVNFFSFVVSAVRNRSGAGPMGVSRRAQCTTKQRPFTRPGVSS